MIYTFKKAVVKYKNVNRVLKAVQNGELVKVSRGIYTSTVNYTDLEYVIKKYPKVIWTLNSAFYYQGFLKNKPDKYYLATTRTALRMHNKNIEQCYQINKIVNLGVIPFKIGPNVVNMYDKERLLIELIRNKNKIDPDVFSEVIHNYFLRKEELDIKKLMIYIYKFKMKRFLVKRINEELDMDLYV